MIYEMFFAIFIAYLFCSWTAQLAWTRYSLWNFLAYNTNGETWNWVLWDLPGILRLLSLVSAAIVGILSLLQGFKPPVSLLLPILGGIIGTLVYIACLLRSQ